MDETTDPARTDARDEAGSGVTAAADEDGTLEVRVLAIGPLDEARWLGRGRMADGTTVDFVTDRAAAELISDAMASGADPIALVTRRQVLR